MKNTSPIDCKYMVVSKQDERYGIYVNAVGYQSVKPGATYPLHSHPTGYFFNVEKGRILHEYQMIYITKGRGIYKGPDSKIHQVCAGRMMLVFPEVWHSYHPLPQNGWDEYYIGFKGNVIDMLTKNGFISLENPVLELGINEELVSLFTKAIEIAREGKVAAQQQLAGIVMHILGKSLAISRNRLFNIDNSGEKIEQAKIIMDENLYQECDSEEIAMRLNISYSWFRKAFKEYTGYAPAKYFQELKLNKAKQLLMESSLPVKEIAYKLGYNATEHFSTLFKKRTGMPPCEYRNSERNAQINE
jgi:AraC-like DNA-binding protein